jgi:hypothetical protein
VNGALTDKGPCALCGRVEQPEAGLLNSYTGVDPCLGLIPGVSQACCGHGFDQPYVVIGGQPGEYAPEYEARTGKEVVVLRWDRALAFFRRMGVGPP